MIHNITQLREENKLSVITKPQQIRFNVELQILFFAFLGFYLVLTLWNIGTRVEEFLLLRRRRYAPKYLPSPASKQSGVWLSFVKHIYLPAMFGETHTGSTTLHDSIPPVSLPLRGQAICMFVYFALNIILGMLAYTSWIRPYYTPIFAAKQWGFFAVLNSLFLVLHAGRASPLLWLTNMSFSTAMFVHRWLGRLIVLESSIHSVMHFYLYIEEEGYTTTSLILGAVPFVSWGMIGCIAAALILLHSWAPFRRLAYECFHVRYMLCRLTDSLYTYAWHFSFSWRSICMPRSAIFLLSTGCCCTQRLYH